jgi:ADP-ribose pyrophosphatase YjhB (NUDIX family)
MLIRLLQTWRRLTSGGTLGVRAVVADERDHVLLVRHSYVSGWHLPGGGVDRGETVGQALARELSEEAGVAQTAPARLHGIFANHQAMPGDHVVVFGAESWHRDEAWRPGLEVRAAAFFDMARLPEGTTVGTRRRLAEIFHGAALSEMW